MNELKTYLVRAVFDWAVDQNLTPHVVVDAAITGTVVPTQYVQEGRIVLNVHPRAIQAFELDDDGLRFSARFGGRAMRVSVPLSAVLAVYARENGQGISFAEAPTGPGEGGPAPEGGGEGETLGRKGPLLRVVK